MILNSTFKILPRDWVLHVGTVGVEVVHLILWILWVCRKDSKQPRVTGQLSFVLKGAGTVNLVFEIPVFLYSINIEHDTKPAKIGSEKMASTPVLSFSFLTSIHTAANLRVYMYFQTIWTIIYL